MPRAKRRVERPSKRENALARGPFTLAVDIGGTFIKASVLDGTGGLIVDPVRDVTPSPAPPAAVIDLLHGLTAHVPPFDRISVGFPGVVKGGTVLTAPNLGTPDWSGFHLIEALANRFGVPARILNDAEVHGLGVVDDDGLACIITLGTGIGCALFRNRRLLLHLEFGQQARGEGTYDQFIGQAALQAIGAVAWNERVRACIATVTSLTNCDVLYIGGGNAQRITFALPPHVRIVSNTAGVRGGVRLWEPELDELFVGVPHARR
jgi:polyphosphate glucokinase